MEFDYFYNRDGDRFSYYMLPKIIVTDERFKNLSSDAKILYSCLLERTSLFFRNKWLDEENRVYIIFTVEEIMEILGRPNKTAVKILNELDSTSGGGIGLIERKKRGLGKSNIIYVKDFMSVFHSECKNYTSEVKNLHSRSVETTPQKMKNVHGSNLNRNNTEYSNPDMSLRKAVYGIFQNVFLTEDEVVDLKEYYKVSLIITLKGFRPTFKVRERLTKTIKQLFFPGSIKTGETLSKQIKLNHTA